MAVRDAVWALALIGFVAVFASALRADDNPWVNPLAKQGYLSSPVVESTPFVFADRLHLLESWQAFFGVPGGKPGDRFHEDVARIRDVETDEIIAVALKNCGFATAFVWEGRVYVFAGDYGQGETWRQIREIKMTSSGDLKNWTPPVTVLKAEGNELLWNTAVCRGEDGFVLLYETDDKRWTPFTFRYCSSSDLVNWTRIDDAVYGREKYVGGPALYYENGWYYTLYLESLGQGRFETRITRSKDLRRWQDAPSGRPFITFDHNRTGLPLRPPTVRETNASDAEVCFFEGRTIVYFTGADQQVGGDLQWATFDGTPRELFAYFFKSDGEDIRSP